MAHGLVGYVSFGATCECGWHMRVWVGHVSVGGTFGSGWDMHVGDMGGRGGERGRGWPKPVSVVRQGM